jgi:hypothetical protein
MSAASRERFRVVAESEFFHSSDLDWPGTPAAAPRTARWARGVAGAALVATASALSGAIAMSVSPAARHPRGRAAVRGSTRPAAASSPAGAGGHFESAELRGRGLRASYLSSAPTRQRARPGRRLRPLVSAPEQVAHVTRRGRTPPTEGLRAAAGSYRVARRAFVAAYVAPPSRARPAEFGFER